MTNGISLLLVDDHALVRNNLATRLDAEEGIRVLGEAGDADQGVSCALELEPEIIMFDIDMPGMSSFEAARTINQRLPSVRMMFLTAFTHDSYIDEALSAGANAYITKREPYEVVVSAIRAVACGEAYFSPEVQKRIVVSTRGATLTPDRCTRAATLTARETEILRHIAQGSSKKQIAKELHLSVNTVDVHTSRIMTKLDIHDRVGLARFAFREGLADP